MPKPARRANLAVSTAGWRRIAAGQSPPWRNGLFILFLAGILAYSGSFCWHLLSRFDLLNIIRDVNLDDSFYYFQIARNLAAGQFSTFDGITQTNGYHPLWLLLITPFYWLMDAETALFGIKGFEIALIAGAVLLTATAARLAGQPWLLLFALPPLLYGNVVLFSGLEAATALFMLGLLFLALGLYARQPVRWQWLLAAVAFALPWARLEYVAISLTATAALGALAASRRRNRQTRLASGGWLGVLTSTATAPFLAAVAGVLVYFAYNWLVFDGLVPVSGAVKAAWSQNEWSSGAGYSLVRNFQKTLQLPVFGYELRVALETCVYAPLVWWLARGAEHRRDWLLLAFLVGVFGLGVGHIAKFVQTVLTVHPRLGHFSWQYVPAYLLAALIIPVRCCVVMYLIRRTIGSRWARTARLLSLSVVVGGVAAVLAKADFAEPFRFVDRSSNSDASRFAPAIYMGAQVANRILPEGSVIGSWDAGLVGYFSRFPVVNLDGLANSYDYFRATNGLALTARGATGARNRLFGSSGELAPYVRQMGITHYVNPARARGAPFNIENTLFDGPPDPNQRRLAITATAPLKEAADTRVWEGLAPHFDQREGGRGEVGLLVIHRLALALARNCRPEEVIVWSWNTPGAKTAFLPGNTSRGPGALCVSEMVLPKAAAVDSVRAMAMPARDYLAQLRGKSLPAIRSQYDVYVTDNRLVYTKESCTEATEVRFMLHLYPADAANLTEQYKERGFENRDFRFRQYGVLADGVCLLNVPLPGYAVTRIRTGQYTLAGNGFNNLWVEESPAELSVDELLAWVDLHNLHMAALPIRDYLAMLKAGRTPIVRSNFDVYLVANRLIYVKEQCQPEAVAANFLLHVYPSNTAVLPEGFKNRAFENQDFEFQAYGVRADGVCLANVPLPPYDFERIRTGQYIVVDDGFRDLWAEEWSRFRY